MKFYPQGRLLGDLELNMQIVQNADIYAASSPAFSSAVN